ncbi:MAG: hypothetical protein AVDCRST_MAG33-1830 [uncultured Thermomicrobiales bacterium]|uniref:Uncharacterized protein n=1 Tax=uncultured Thermomicrobiales bacterium TaxID=1645740 RepID=A0A6J4V040_9BACT|nr:MAG: hypothetical protein AVDCRST_MAG33-1830 [uncultured Thermomicrobiales bacterium]
MAVVLVLLLGVGSGIAYLRGFVPSVPSFGLGRDSGDETAAVTATATGTMPNVGGAGTATETVTIYGAVCPADYAGKDYFADCYDTPAAGAGYTLAVGESRLPDSGVAVAGEDGLVAPTGADELEPGTVVLQAIAPNEVVGSGGFSVPAAVCTSDDGRTVELSMRDSEAGGQLFAFDLRAGEDLRCDVYFVPLTVGSEAG